MSNKVVFTVSIPKELEKVIRDKAKQENRNVSNMTTVLLEKGLKINAA